MSDIENNKEDFWPEYAAEYGTWTRGGKNGR